MEFTISMGPSTIFESRDNDADVGDNIDAKFSSEEEEESPGERGPSSISRKQPTSQATPPPAISNQNAIYNGTIDPLHSPAQIQRNQNQNIHIIVPNPPNQWDNISDMFKYYEKTYPEEFIYYLRLRCTITSCNICFVCNFGWNMDHYYGRKHAQTLRKYFRNWKKNKKAQQQVQARQIQESGPGSSLFTGLLCTSGSGLNNCSNVICTKCAQRGHKREKCPQNLICGRCGSSGHSKKFCMAFGEDSDSDEIEIIVPSPKPGPEVVDLEAEETGPDKMPTFEMDSAYIKDRIKKEIQIEVPVPDNIVDIKKEDSITESVKNTDPTELATFEMDSAYIEDRIKQEIQIEVPDNIVDLKKEECH